MKERSIINGDMEDTEGLDLDSVSAMVDNVENEDYLAKTATPDTTIITEEMMDEELGRIQTMNYIEIHSFRKDLVQQMKDIAEVKAVAEQFVELEEKTKAENSDNEADPLTSRLQLENLSDKASIKADGSPDIHKFLDGYEESRMRMEQTLQKVDERIREFDTIEKTASFMNDCMVSIAKRRIEQLENNTAIVLDNKKKLIYYYKNMEKIYSERDNVDFILQQIDKKKNLMIKFINRANRSYKNNTQSPYTSVSIAATRAFSNIFNVNQMQSFDGYLASLFNPEKDPSDTSTWLVQYALYLIYSDEKLRKYGEHKWIEALILNVLNILDGSYDLENGIEYFDKQLLKIRDAVMKGLPSLKVK